jgi:serine/threonine protein phosphatase PrpC
LANTVKLKSVKLLTAARTDVGRRRTENQDSYGYVVTEHASLFVVADGMGGARGGGTASAMAVQLIVDGAIDEQSGQLNLQSLKRAIRLSNRVIFSRSQQDSQLSGMGTTVVALAFVDSQVIVAHVGDSRIYLSRDGSVSQLTRDHTLVQELVDTGAIPQQDAATHPIAHMLTRSLGPTEAIGVEIHTLPQAVRPGDKFLLCSDGLYNHVSNERIGEILSRQTPSEGVNQLVQLALDGGGSDNVTIQIIEVCGLNDERIPNDNGIPYPQKFVSSEIDVSEFNGMTLGDFVASVNGVEESEDEAEQPGEEMSLEENGSEEPAISSVSLTAAPVSTDEPEEPPHALFGDSGADSGGELEVPRSGGVRFAMALLFAGLLCAGIFIIFSRPPAPAATQRGVRNEPKQPLIPAQDEKSPEEPDSTVLSSAPSLPVAEPSANPIAEENLLPEHETTPLVEPSAVPSPLISKEAIPTEAISEEQRLHDRAVAEKFSEDQKALQAQPSPTAAEVPVEPIETPVLELTDNMKKYAETISLAGDFRVPPAPRLSLGGEKAAPPDQPIVWENESKLVAKVVEEKHTADQQQVAANVPKLRTDDENKELAEKKDRLRDKISDLDMKLASLVFETKDEAKNKLTRLEMELNRTSEAIAALQADTKESMNKLATWEALQKKTGEIEPLKLADEVAELSSQIKEKRAQYRDATENYLTSVDKWQNNPKDVQAASTMAALGRDLKARRVELELAVGKSITRGVNEEKRLLQRLQFDLANLERRRNALSRQSGLLGAFVPMTLPRKQEMQKKFLEERNAAQKNLLELQEKFSDDDETEFRLEHSELFLASLS